MQEYRIRHDWQMDEADIIVVYNGVNHFIAASKERFSCRCAAFACKTKIANQLYNL